MHLYYALTDGKSSLEFTSKQYFDIFSKSKTRTFPKDNMNIMDFAKTFDSDLEPKELARDIFWKISRMPKKSQKLLLEDAVENGVRIDTAVLKQITIWFPKTSCLRGTQIAAVMQVISDQRIAESKQVFEQSQVEPGSNVLHGRIRGGRRLC